MPTKLHPNRGTHDKVMTSYRFFTMEGKEVEIYPPASVLTTALKLRHDPLSLILHFFR